MGKDATSRPEADLPEKEATEEKVAPESEEAAGSSESPETPEDKEDTASLEKRLKGYDKSLKESQERGKALERELIEARKSGMSEDAATKYELETTKAQIKELQQANQYYQGELAKRDLLKDYKHASQFAELLYGTPEEMKEQADKLEKYIESKRPGESEEPSPPPIDRDLPPPEREETADEEFDKLDVDEMRKRLPKWKR